MYEAQQPDWVKAELTAEQQEVLSAPRGTLASTFPATRTGTHIAGGALRESSRAELAGTRLDYIRGVVQVQEQNPLAVAVTVGKPKD